MYWIEPSGEEIGGEFIFEFFNDNELYDEDMNAFFQNPFGEPDKY